MVKRTLTYKLQPSKAQALELERHRLLHKELHNAALQERRDAWARGHRVTLRDQERSLKLFKHDLPEWAKVHSHSMQLTLKRLDLAFQAFFRRVAAGETPGYPRFKARDRYPGWSYKEHGNGFRFEPGPGWKHGWIRLSGIGRMQVRGRVRTPGVIKTCTVSKKVDRWYVTIAVETECEARAPAPAGTVTSLDWGVETLATCAHGAMGSEPEIEAVENDRFLAAEIEEIRAAQKVLSKRGRGPKRSRQHEREKKLFAKRARKVANRRKDRAHKLSAWIVRGASVILTEALNIRGMTASARGTVEDPGRNVAQKSGLNRNILDTSPGILLNMLAYKAEEAGTEFILVNTRKHKPSQTCPGCGAVAKKALSERVHTCAGCGYTCGRDEASARVLFALASELSARDRASVAA